MTSTSTAADNIKSPEKTGGKNYSFHLDFTKIYQFYEEQRIIENENKKILSKSIEPILKKKTQCIQKKDFDDDLNQITSDSPDKVIKNSSGFHKYKNNIELLRNLKEVKNNNNSHDTNDENKVAKTSYNMFLNQTRKENNKSSSNINYSMKKSFNDYKVSKESSHSPVNFIFNDCKVTFKTNIIQNPTEADKSSLKEVNIKNLASVMKNKNNINNNNILITNSVYKPVAKDYISRNLVPEMPTINNNKYNNIIKNHHNNSTYNSSINMEKTKENGGKRHISVSPNIIMAKVKGISIFPSKKNVISVDNKMFKIIKDNNI